ncbi:porin family protein [Leisingera daeponensis]|uniref:Porin family protein n=1 Tax=Leisingera daeponensis TaxID=405746 RepID=A0ABS7NHX9_9RHOB|nr:outer membrane beta-barrel protein [Leisingera daeponensis]MBY6140818.1 porin family protein [Leisingera daeponensis]
MKRKVVPALLLLSAATASPALAGDWEGGYIGGQIGYGSGDFDLGTLTDLDTDGAVGGFTVGYLWELGDWAIGPELQYDFSDLSINSGGASGDFDGIARLKLRAGYDLGNALLYGSLGFAYTNFDGLSGVTGIDLDDPGYVIGFGYDHQINDRWVIGGEYQYHKFDDFGTDGNDVDFGTLHVRAMFRF